MIFLWYNSNKMLFTSKCVYNPEKYCFRTNYDMGRGVEQSGHSIAVTNNYMLIDGAMAAG